MNGLSKYTVNRDHFELSKQWGLSFPCICCTHRESKVSDHPCRVCDHNTAAGPETAESAI